MVRHDMNKAEKQADAGADSQLTAHDSQSFLGRLARKIFILPIRIYQLTLSPLLGTHCRHTPSCSQYTIEAIAEWGPIKGIWLGMKRISRCHPWGTSGYDPVPKKEK